MKKLFLLFTCIFTTSCLHAQTYVMADSLWNEAKSAESSENYLKAAQFYEQAAEAEKKCKNPRGEDLYFELAKSSYNYHEANMLDKAFEIRIESLEQCVKVFGKDHENYTTASNWAGMYYTQKGEYEMALPLFLQALENTEKILGKEHENYGKRLSNLAGLYENMGLYDLALPLYLEALENTKKSQGIDSEDYGLRLNDLAVLYISLGQYERALPLLLAAKENTEKILGKEHEEYGIRLNNLAQLYKNLGQFEKAIPLSIEAMEITEKLLGKDDPSYGIRLNNLAELYKIVGQYDKALLLSMEALENTEKVLGKNHYQYGIRLNNLAVLYDTKRQYEKALPLYLEALENTKITLGKDHSEYGIRLNNLAVLYKNMGQYEKALPLYNEALENAEKSLGKEHSEYGVRLNNLAMLYKDKGQYEKALPLSIEALENTAKSLGKAHSYYETRLSNLADIYERLGQNDKALPLYLEAIDNTIGQIDRAFSFMSEKEKEMFQETVGINFEIYLNFFNKVVKEKPEVAGLAYNIELATKGLILNSSIDMRSRIMASGDKDAIEKFDEWIGLRTLVSKEYNKALQDRRTDLSEVEEKAEQLEASLSRISSVFGSADSLSKVTWQNVQKGLAKNEVAIEFTSFDFRNNGYWPDSVIYCALVLRPEDAHPLLIQLFEQKQLDSLLISSAEGDGNAISNLYRGAEAEVTNQTFTGKGKQLYNLIWQPIESYLSNATDVYFAPSGKLHQIAFSALRNREDQYLSATYQLHQLSTTAKIVSEQDKPDAIGKNQIVLFGGITYDLEKEEWQSELVKENQSQNILAQRSASLENNRGESWNYLPGTLKEVEQIADFLASKSVNYQLIKGGSALEEKVFSFSGANSPHVLHFATHGFFFEDIKSDLIEREKHINQQGGSFRSNENPLQRSGLIFAGGNSTWAGIQTPEGAADGILTAYEVANLSLPNTKLVVLSACETGRGEIKGSEGVFGLQRAFKSAGAEYVMMSLWKVPDEETAEFMEHFYKIWNGGESIRNAFFKTQEIMRNKYLDDPYRWAAFVLMR